ncbi:MAG: hypothetical protein FI680_01835 [SAR202 cluster bacterium]|nr:hypothetical protein [SAR202 cluster bacterium]
MPKRGPKIQEWMKTRVFQIEIELRERHQRRVYAPEVRAQLERYLKTAAMPGSSPSVRLIDRYALPGQRAISMLLANNPYRTTAKADEVWSIGASSNSGIPDDATGAIIAVWKFALSYNPMELFTLPMARYVSKLRWVPEAGGASDGTVVNPEVLYRTVTKYAAREKKVTMLKGTKGMQSGALDGELTLDPLSFQNAYRRGWLIDDTDIDYEKRGGLGKTIDFKRYLDRKASQRKEHGSDKQGTIYTLEAIFNVFRGQAEKAADMLKDGLERFLFEAQENPLDEPLELSDYAIDMARDLAQAYKDGKMDTWIPPIATLKEKYFPVSK